MNMSNRANLLSKSLRVLKKHYKAVNPPGDRSVLEHLMYACCLENSKHEHVDEVLAKLQQNYFDWNEVRVTTVAELAEVMSVLTDPAESASRLKRTLHSLFETHYSFDLDFYKKQNLGKATKEIEKVGGVSPFALAYLVQNALGGHAIPVNRSGLQTFMIIGAISEADAAKGRVPGLERAIPKTKGVEYGSLLHQFSVDFAHSPHSPRVKNLLLEIAPDAKDRFPKRTTTKKADPKSKRSSEKRAAEKEKAKAPAKKKKKAAQPRAAKKKSPTKRLTRKKPR